MFYFVFIIGRELVYENECGPMDTRSWDLFYECVQTQNKIVYSKRKSNLYSLSRGARRRRRRFFPINSLSEEDE